MANTIVQYREAKSTYLKLRDQAKKDLLLQFHSLTQQLFQIQRELRDDFGHKVAIPTKPKAGKPRKSAAPVQPAAVTVSTPKTAAIERRLTLQRQKLEEAGKAGKATQSIKDRIYELEDELRLAREA